MGSKISKPWTFRVQILRFGGRLPVALENLTIFSMSFKSGCEISTQDGARHLTITILNYYIYISYYIYIYYKYIYIYYNIYIYIWIIYVNHMYIYISCFWMMFMVFPSSKMRRKTSKFRSSSGGSLKSWSRHPRSVGPDMLGWLRNNTPGSRCPGCWLSLGWQVEQLQQPWIHDTKD